ncbi:MAG: hypothetical protein ABGZ17_05445, partial [Planctomycetaceae bacterium]
LCRIKKGILQHIRRINSAAQPTVQAKLDHAMKLVAVTGKQNTQDLLVATTQSVNEVLDR